MRLTAGARTLLVTALAAALAAATFLVVSSKTYAIGFPLDDAWIHQTYARNLVEFRQWAFVPGVPSAGSTSPLWTGLMALGRFLGIDPRWWAFAVGVSLLIITACLSARWIERRGSGAWAWLAGPAVALEWHLVWASLSGMEILALTCVIVAVLLTLTRERLPSLPVGLLVGVGVWIRPDALLLLVAVGWAIAVRRGTGVNPKLLASLKVGVGVLLLLGPYLAFNRLLAGEWWPSTFYAKQAEYALLIRDPLPIRLLNELVAPLAGLSAVLSPGMLASLMVDVRLRRWERLAPWLWVGAFALAYAVRLPATYQHGRYMMPILPVIVALGVEGSLGWLRRGGGERWRRILGRAWAVAVPIVACIFLALGARAYATDVAVIETEMVASARWIADHTPPGALIAAHDIGALGYFGGRPILDLAGLATPEVIPFIRDEARLKLYLDQRGADYLMTFPGWYPLLIQSGKPVFTTHGPFSPAAGGENMVVYRWEDTAFARSLPAMLYSRPIAPRQG